MAIRLDSLLNQAELAYQRNMSHVSPPVAQEVQVKQSPLFKAIHVSKGSIEEPAGSIGTSSYRVGGIFWVFLKAFLKFRDFFVENSLLMIS